MAEQVSHHVVNQSESAGAAASAGVAANPIDIDIAVDGAHPAEPTTTDPKSESLTAADPVATAEPSAGEAVGKDAEATEAPSESVVNGLHDGEASVEEGSAVDGSADHSVNSDTEGSKGDSTEQKKEGSHHVRTNSVKKPTTFSRVSATKSFMAKTASPAPAAPAIGSKPSSLSAAPQPAAAARPRLVAKTVALKSLQKPRAGSESASGPDASKVWNKNQPVAPPPPKQFTDEELKQQYGIHLATRLQTDESGQESKWADIDEDEEDWAPEAVVWMDGTKSTITPAEAAAPPLELKPEVPQPAKPAEGAKPSLAVKRPSEMGPPKTILKPGIALAARLQNGASGTTSSTDKPSLKAKSPAPTPAKSPWAALPPVETISPIITPVQQAAQPSTLLSALPSQDARSYEPQHPPQPAREIAADTFERSWREGEGAPRELFNSANGRYEPAPEGRRSSMKPDGPPRKPAVLQRPSQAGQSPAEPSAAFQTRTSSQTEGSWPRRRGSSVSQGSQPPGRRMSVSRPSDLPPTFERERRQSSVMGHEMHASPRSARVEPAKPNFTQQSAWDQQMPPKPEPGTEAEDPNKIQERIMREKREEARKRKKEDDERDEKLKQERLKARLANLEGAGKSRKEREAEAAAAAAAQKSAATKPVEPLAPAERPGVSLKPAEDSAAATPAFEDQSLPPTQPDAAPLQSPIQDKLPSPLPPKPQQLAGLSDRPSSSTDQAQRQTPRTHLSPRANPRTPFGQQPAPYRPPQSSYSSPGDRKQQAFGRSPLTNSDAFSSWNTTAPNGSVWGTSGIGNGTFEKAGSFAPMPMSQQNLPPPPGMSRPSPSSNMISPPQAFGQDTRSPSLQQPPLAEQQRIFPPPGIESRPEAVWGQSRTNGVSPAPGLGRQTHIPGPIAPPSRAQQQQQPPVQRPDPLSAWNNAAATLPHQYAADANAAERKQQEALPAPPRDDTFKETFKQTAATQGRLGGPRRFDKTEYTVHDAQGSRSVSTLTPAPPSTQTQPVGPVPTASPNDPWKQAENTVRIPDGSLNPAHGGLPLQQPPIGPPSAQQAPATTYQGQVNFPVGPLPGVSPAAEQQSPPPPETSSHPANDGDARHPNVKLPPPPPRVRLPPASPAQTHSSMQQPPVAMPQRPVQVWGPPGVARPLVMNEDWQARFNGLFNRAPMTTEVPPSPPKTPPKSQGPALAIAASSRTAMDELPAAIAATVSLPQYAVKKNVTPEGFTIDESADIVSKPTIDPIFTEELSFGSLPTVNVPSQAMYDPDVYGGSKFNMLKMGMNSKLQRTIDAQTGVDLTAGHNLTFYFHKHPQGYFVKLPGTKLSNRLVKAAVTGSRKASAMQQQPQHERKPSGLFGVAGKAPAREARGGNNSKKGSGASSPATNGTPTNAGSRKTSFQKAVTPVPASAAPVASPANAESAGRKQGKWTRRNNAPVNKTS
ncbi:hypothetical protein LTR36_004257 [Oleoguttula mirabilis]|uniref:Uncharacterized protein n=1 Tax=Oleoguttula mirabilis TaxID=1507867 RepID=A0AAV9JIN3_9PEZI|nr:hypothetical protein LTR36_004257 [Oleoguttula mirabilis]